MMKFCLAAALVLSLQLCAQAAEPDSAYTLEEDNFPAVMSPDGTLSVENYYRADGPDGTYLWQFWVFAHSHKNGWLLNATPNADYGAGFRFTPDSQWLVRLQKIGAGTSTVFLYQRQENQFSPEIPLGDLTWNYFYRLPENNRMQKADLHLNAFLVKGLENHYQKFHLATGLNPYLILGLSGEVDEPHQHTVVQDWFCLYDLKNKTFSVPPQFTKQNTAALTATP